MASSRGEFSSSFGFIMAAAGSAIGLGNIWGFPTQTAQNGGAAFVLVYLGLAFVIGFPVLMAEFIIGRHSRSNPVGAYSSIEGGKLFVPAGYFGILVVGLILSFYSIVAGWMLSYLAEPIFQLFGADEIAAWCINGGPWKDILFTSLFYVLTISIITKGVKSGIEKWSTRLMPSLLILIVILIIYVFTLPGATEGLKVYLLPDFTKIANPDLILSALGQAFFSLSLGVGTMLVYGSYIPKKENLVRLGILVTLADIGIAFMAGLLIIPAMYVALNNGTEIFDEAGNLLKEDTLIFQVLPQLFESLGGFGIVVAIVFFLLMVIASLTSSISMLEVPVAFAVDTRKQDRKKSTFLLGAIFWIISIIIIFNMGELFGLVITVTTKYSQPLLGLFICVFIGWAMHRDKVLNELKEGNPAVADSVFMKVWPFFIRFVCPILILIVFIQSL